MPRPAASQPTDVELRILHVLWNTGPSTARGIHNQLVTAKDTNYSTTVKMLAVMLDKGLVRRDESVRPMVYRAAATQKSMQGRMLNDLIRRVYDGSAKSLVLQALSGKQTSAQDLKEIRQMLDELERET